MTIMYRKYRVPPLHSHPEASFYLNSMNTSTSSFSKLPEPSMISKLENKKKHLIGVSKQYDEALKSSCDIKDKLKQHLRQSRGSSRIGVRIKNLNNSLSNTLVIYNNNLQANSSHKKQINLLRKDRLRNKDIIEKLQQEIEETNRMLDQKKQWINTLEKLQQQSMNKISYLQQIDKQTKQKFDQQLECLDDQYHKQEEQLAKHHYDLMNNTQIILDTHVILKNRLKTIIQKNKQIHQEVNNYQSVLMTIRSQFEQIMEAEKVDNLNEVANLFKASYQQNQSLYSYINTLSTNTTDSEKQVKDLENKINIQKQKSDMVKKENKFFLKQRYSLWTYQDRLDHNAQKINNFKSNILEKIADSIKETLLYFAKQNGEETYYLQNNFDLNQSSIISYLSDLQKYAGNIYQSTRLRKNSRNKFTRLAFPPIQEISSLLHCPVYYEQNGETDKHILNPFEFDKFAEQFLEIQSPKFYQQPK